jgi:hypothetical protein
VFTRRSLLVLVAVVGAACGGGRSELEAQDPGPSAEFTVVDEQTQLTEEQRDALAERGLHPDGLLQGLPDNCRLVEGVTGPDQQSTERIVAGLRPQMSRGPLVAVDVSDGSTVLATTLVAADGVVADTAAWVVDGDAPVVTAANSLAAELTDFELERVDTAAETPVSSALAAATDCSWVVADVTHADPPEPEPQMQPELLVLDPATAAPGQLVAMRFPEQTSRGVAFQLDRRTADGWVPVAWMTSDGNGGEPTTVPAFAEGYSVHDVGVRGPGPDHVRLPDDVPPGDYRICTANAGEDFCAPLEIATG